MKKFTKINEQKESINHSPFAKECDNLFARKQGLSLGLGLINDLPDKTPITTHRSTTTHRRHQSLIN